MPSAVCSRCAAPLPREAAEGKVPCPHCGSLWVPGEAAPRTWQEQSPPPTGSRVAWIYVLVVMAGSLAVGLAQFARTAATRATKTAVHVPARGITTEGLRTQKQELSELLDAAPPPGAFSAFEPVANLPWALAIAQAWVPDARPNSIYIERVRPDGTVNLQDDGEASVMYRFASESRLQEAREQLELGGSKVATELHVRLTPGTMRVTLRQDEIRIRHPEPMPSYPQSLPLPQILRSALSSDKLKRLPFYQGQLSCLQGDWAWNIHTPVGAYVWVRASDGTLR